ncbi:MAG TPA: hypothetical protein VME67_14700 [Mycobacterium sp.]|nr:hypothetical protein [Mycobacterium sp.]HTX95992.1 hypothetical protein [Mycobacterium sp.]
MSTPLNFASWVQPAAAGALPLDDANTHPTAPSPPAVDPPLRVGVQLQSTVGNAPRIDAPQGNTRLLGPGDVVGLDPAQIVRRFPAPDTAGSNTTHLAFIDFAATDLPWRFSPVTATATTPPQTRTAQPQNRVRPWLVLLVVTADNEVSTDAGYPRITVPPDQLPDLSQSWAWAHAQLDDPADCVTGRSRLLCPRQLPSGMPMRAILVPAFAAGLTAALGSPMRTAPNPPPTVHEPAWPSPATESVTLPVYDSWTFTTGDGLDFETLAKRITPLKPGAMKDFGSTDVDVGDQVNGGVLPVDTALGPINPTPLSAGQQAILDGCAQVLVEEINSDVTAHALCPPIRGQYHAGRNLLDPAAPTWLDMANRDPRRRLAAAHGAVWVNANQDDLMAQAWQQAGQVREAARLLSTARTALAITDSLHRRHVLPLSVDEAIRLKAPAGSQLPVAAGTATHSAAPPLADVLQASAAPDGAGGTRFARLIRTLATLKVSTTLTATGKPRVPIGAKLTSKAMAGEMFGMPGVSTISPTEAAPPAPTPVDAAAPATPPWGLQILLGANKATQTSDYLARQWNLVSGVQAALSGMPSTTTQGITPMVVTAGGIDQQPINAIALASRGLPTSGRFGVTALYVTADAAASVWGSTPSPNNAVAQRVSSRLTTASGSSPVHITPPGPIAIRPANAHAADAQLVVDIRLALPTPQVAAPLGLALLEQNPNWLVAGATEFPDDTATLLQPNAEVIEAVLLGANYAMLDEYLWRGFPTDRRGTPIRRFWPTSDAAHNDIPPIDQWNTTSPLGTHLASDAATTLTLLMLRSELFQRYPDLVIGAVPAVMTTPAPGVPTPDRTAQLKAPAFPLIAIDARTRIIGFTGIDHASVMGLPGWYFVLIEPPSGLRFGFEHWPAGSHPFLDDPFDEGYQTSAELAQAAFQPPVRVFLHSSLMVGTA